MRHLRFFNSAWHQRTPSPARLADFCFCRPHPRDIGTLDAVDARRFLQKLWPEDFDFLEPVGTDAFDTPVLFQRGDGLRRQSPDNITLDAAHPQLELPALARTQAELPNINIVRGQNLLELPLDSRGQGRDLAEVVDVEENLTIAWIGILGRVSEKETHPGPLR